MDRKRISLFTDGSCNGNPGPGGYAVIIRKGKHQREVIGNVPHSTNNRMELIAITKGLEELQAHSLVNVYTDSAYVERAINEGRLEVWKNNGWRRIRTGTPVMNADLWKNYLSIIQKKNLDVKIRKVTAHRGCFFNNRADSLAKKAAQSA